MQKTNESLLLAILSSSFFLLLISVAFYSVFIHYSKKKKLLLKEKMEREANFRQELLQAQLEMQEHTFKTVSQEIHDNVGQILSIIKLHLNILTFHNESDEQLESVKDMLTCAITELRDLSAGYYADRLVEEGFLVAIQHQLKLLEKTGLFTTDFQTKLETLSIEKSKVIFLHRIVQEILHNVVKHSGGTHVHAQIEKENKQIHILLSDNGKGFDSTDPSFKAGIGLSSISQRATMIDANLEISSALGMGTSVKISLAHE